MKALLTSTVLLALGFVACDGNGKPAPSAPTPTHDASPSTAPSARPQPVAPSGDLILRGGDHRQDIFRIDADGGNPVNLSMTPALDEPGALSPDGTLAAFSRRPDPFAPADLFVAQPDGSGERHLTDTPDSNEHFVPWSPDGRRILFGEFTEATGQWSVINPDGSGRKVIVPRCQNCVSPHWSPGGASLLAELSMYGQSGELEAGLFVISPDGSVQRKLPDSPIGWDEAIWSPDGKTIAYLAGSTRGFGRLSVVDADGSDLRELWSGQQPYGIAWSPDGSHIGFAVDGLKVVIIELVSAQARVLASGGRVGGVAWSPDSDSIAFHADGLAGDLDIFAIPAGGGAPTNLTNLAGDDFSPSWSRDGKIYFTSLRDSAHGVYAINQKTEIATMVQRFTSSDVHAEDIRLPPTAGGCEPLRDQLLGQVRLACLSPDGEARASVEVFDLQVSNVADARVLVRTPSPLRVESSPPAWSHDGSRVAFIAGEPGDTYLHTMDVATGSIRRLVPADALGNSSPTLLWSADNASIYFTRGSRCRGGCLTGFLYRVNIDGSGEQQITDLRVQTLYGFAQ